MNEVKLIILDMDGTILDTERNIGYLAYLKAAQKLGFEFNQRVYTNLKGRSAVQNREMLRKIYGEDSPYAEYRNLIDTYKHEFVSMKKRPMKKKGLIELLQYCKNHEIKLAVASSSVCEIIHRYFEIEEIGQCFDYIISGDEVTLSKPDPEIFLKACKKSGIDKEHAIIVEDSAAGIEAANRADICSVFVEDDISDLPSIQGHYKIKKDLLSEKEMSINANFKRKDLAEVIEILQN